MLFFFYLRNKALKKQSIRHIQSLCEIWSLHTSPGYSNGYAWQVSYKLVFACKLILMSYVVSITF